MRSIGQRDQKVYITIILTCVIFLFVLAYLGLFSRLMADDYCLAFQASTEGVLGTAIYQYNTWSGRFILMLGLASIYNIGQLIIMIVPALLLALWFFSSFSLLYQLLKHTQTKNILLAATIGACLITYATFAGVPSIIQSLYWSAGSLSYTVSIPGLMLFFALFLRTLRINPKGEMPIAILPIFAIIALISGGLSELSASFQVVIFGLLFSVAVIRGGENKRQILSILIVGLVFSLLIAVVMFAAPGNSIRQAAFGAPLPIATLIERVLVISASYIATVIAIFAPFHLLFLVALPAIVIAHIPFDVVPYRLNQKQVRRLLLISTGVCVLLVIATVAPPVYGTHSAPPPRAYIFPHFILVCTAAFWGVVMGLGSRQMVKQDSSEPYFSRKIVAVIAVLLLVGPIAATVKAGLMIPVFTTFAAEWDVRDQEIRQLAASGQQRIVVQPLSYDLAAMSGLDPIQPESARWFNKCVADYYGIESIAAIEPDGA